MKPIPIIEKVYPAYTAVRYISGMGSNLTIRKWKDGRQTLSWGSMYAISDVKDAIAFRRALSKVIVEFNSCRK